MFVFRSRLAEFFRDTLQPEILSRFGAKLSLKGIETSCCIHVRHMLLSQEVTKYQLALFMELLTGVPPVVHATDVFMRDPTQEQVTVDEMLRVGRLRGHNKLGGKLTPGLSEKESKMLMKGIANGLEVTSNLRDKESMFNFLDKMREFYVPDDLPSLGNGSPTPLNNSDSHCISKNYQYKLKNSRLGYCVETNLADREDGWKALNLTDDNGKNGESASDSDINLDLHEDFIPNARQPVYLRPCFTLPAVETLKFPDIEIYIETFSDLLLSGKKNLRVNVRPLFVVEPQSEYFKSCPSSSYSSSSWNPVEACEYACSVLFSPNLIRCNLFANDEAEDPLYLFSSFPKAKPFTVADIDSISSVPEKIGRAMPLRPDGIKPEEASVDKTFYRELQNKKINYLNDFGYLINKNEPNHIGMWYRKQPSKKPAPIPWTQLQKPLSK